MVCGIILSLVCFYTILLHSILLVLFPNCRRKSWCPLGWMFASPYMLGDLLLFNIQSRCPDLQILRSLFLMSANVLTLIVHVPWTTSFLPWKHILDKCAEKWFHGHHYSPPSSYMFWKKCGNCGTTLLKLPSAPILINSFKELLSFSVAIVSRTCTPIHT